VPIREIGVAAFPQLPLLILPQKIRVHLWLSVVKSLLILQPSAIQALTGRNILSTFFTPPTLDV
jgi:hypothetical protein